MELTGPRAKLQWALQQLKALDDEVRGILETEPFRIADEFDEDSGCHVMRFRGRKNVFPLHLSLRVGDAIHNGRSALDHGAWLLALRSTPIERLWDERIARQIAFPPVWDEKRLPRHSVMSFIADDAKAVLQGLQTHEGGDTAAALRDLDLLWNIDKHRVLHRGVAELDVSPVKFRYGALDPKDVLAGSPEITMHPLPTPLKDGTEIATVRYRSGLGPPHTEVEVHGQPSVLVGFGGGLDAFAIDEIGRLFVHVHKTLGVLEGLPDAP